MKSGGYFVLGGLLQGLGAGITNQENQRRADALAALKRSEDVQDRDAKLAAAKDIAQTQVQGKLDAITTTGKENRATEEVRGTQDRLTESVKSEAKTQQIKLEKSLDLSNSTTLEGIKHKYNLSEQSAKSLLDTAHDLKLANITPDHYEVMGNGQIVVWKKDGTAYVRGNNGDFVPRNSGDDEGASIGGTKAAREGGTAPAPKAQAPAPAANPQKGAALAHLGAVYMQIANDRSQWPAMQKKYPGMFDSQGNLLPKSVLIDQVNARFGG